MELLVLICFLGSIIGSLLSLFGSLWVGVAKNDEYRIGLTLIIVGLLATGLAWFPGRLFMLGLSGWMSWVLVVLMAIAGVLIIMFVKYENKWKELTFWRFWYNAVGYFTGLTLIAHGYSLAEANLRLGLSTYLLGSRLYLPNMLMIVAVLVLVISVVMSYPVAFALLARLYPYLLAKIALGNDNSDIRLAALKMIIDQPLLEKVAMEGDSYVCHPAVERIIDQAALARVAIDADDYSVRTKATKKISDQAALAIVAMNNKHEDLREIATKKLNDQFLLSKIATAVKFRKKMNRTPPVFSN
jgi:hypothetical protein